ncbi:UPF0481 protein At3g47200-like [Solanum stenotomum]|uniref:UPF0481 protein At3g47200-like n=1 Tax=Solanum stenotomum TaxID=172797 RepID=UPI0020D05F4C|nr:UPF0481 protein At3g47200-like [Solanum stenotomum]
MAATEAVKKAIWLKGLVAELSLVQLELIIRCDRQSVIHLIKNQRFHEHTKHIDVIFHFIRDVIEDGDIKVEKVITDNNVADMLTKTVLLAKFAHYKDLAGIGGKKVMHQLIDKEEPNDQDPSGSQTKKCINQIFDEMFEDQVRRGKENRSGHEIKEGKKVMHQLIDKKETNDQDPSGSQTKKCINQIFDEMFEDLDNSSIKSCIIFKVNVRLRESNPDAYTPKMVSIGPYHKKNPQLGPMEKYKLLYLQRLRKEGLDVKSCITYLEHLKEEALKCYDDIEDLDTDGSHEFCKMLLLDGCFVVEFIRECSEIYPKGEEKIISFVDYKYNQILRDLLLLENQLPFFILDWLHLITMQDDDELSLEELSITMFSRVVNLGYILTCDEYHLKRCRIYASDMKHLLQVVHGVSCQRNFKICSNDDIKWNKVMPNATELSEAGVSFAKVSNMTSLFDIKFENGLMTMPSLHVVDSTEILLRNLIAYEQQSIDLEYLYFSDYATFMDHLINSNKDVKLLRRKGIIKSWIGDDKEVARIFNKMRNGVRSYSTFYYHEQYTSISAL